MSGKYLANMLKKKSRSNFIENIQMGKGEKVYSIPDIVRAFQDYHWKLYSITQKETPDKAKERLDNIKVYLNELGLKKIPLDKLSTLEHPITETEIIKILRVTSREKPWPRRADNSIL